MAHRMTKKMNFYVLHLHENYPKQPGPVTASVARPKGLAHPSHPQLSARVEGVGVVEGFLAGSGVRAGLLAPSIQAKLKAPISQISATVLNPSRQNP